MIKTLAVAATVLLATAVCTTTADARITCVARSVQAMGYGISPRLATAKTIALAQCAVRTRRGLMCRITACR
jgi:hypothetical protein